MLPPKLNDSLLNGYLFNVLDSMNENKISEPIEERKVPDRQQPALSSNEILLIEFGIILIVIFVVGLVFYLSHRNSKKRVNRRRWMQSDLNIDHSNDGQIYDTTTEEGQQQPHDSVASRRRWLRHDIGINRDDHQAIDRSLDEHHSQTIRLAQDDCPPSYESVIQQKKRKRSGTTKNNAKRLDRILPKCHNANEEEPLSPVHISIICNEHSSLIENQQSASTSSDVICSDGNKICSLRANCFNEDVNNHKLQQVVLGKAIGEMETTGKRPVVPTETVKSGIGIAVLDASGLPTYDTALKIQECGNM